VTVAVDCLPLFVRCLTSNYDDAACVEPLFNAKFSEHHQMPAVQVKKGVLRETGQKVAIKV
jgi:hypothetical protein